jgi:hypothetical protein
VLRTAKIAAAAHDIGKAISIAYGVPLGVKMMRYAFGRDFA